MPIQHVHAKRSIVLAMHSLDSQFGLLQAIDMKSINSTLKNMYDCVSISPIKPALRACPFRRDHRDHKILWKNLCGNKKAFSVRLGNLTSDLENRIGR